MTRTTRGAKPTRATPKRKAAGGCKTTTATTSNAIQTIALYARMRGAAVRLASWLAVLFRGVA